MKMLLIIEACLKVIDHDNVFFLVNEGSLNMKRDVENKIVVITSEVVITIS